MLKMIINLVAGLLKKIWGFSKKNVPFDFSNRFWREELPSQNLALLSIFDFFSFCLNSINNLISEIFWNYVLYDEMFSTFIFQKTISIFKYPSLDKISNYSLECIVTYFINPFPPRVKMRFFMFFTITLNWIDQIWKKL